MERYWSKGRDLHIIFIDLEETYDQVSMELLWKDLGKKGVCMTYIRAILDMYNGITTSMKTSRDKTKDFL